MNEVINVIMGHRSIRQFKSNPVGDDVLETIIRAAQRASTSSNVQAYSVIAVRDEQLKQQLAQVAGDQRYIIECPLFLVWCADLHRNRVAVENNGAEMISATMDNFVVATVDAALAAQTAAIAAESLGLGIVYIGGIRNDLKKATELLQLPELVYPVFGMCVGYPAHDPGQRPRLPLEGVLHHETYNADATEAIQQYDTVMHKYYFERSGGKLDTTWSQQMAAKYSRASRNEFLDYLIEQGFLTK